MTLHPSQLAKWSQCERYGLNEHLSPRKDRPAHISAWVGTAAHQLIAGGEVPPAPERVRFDPITPTMDKAFGQARLIHRAFTDLVRAQGWKVLRSEYPVSALVGRTMVAGTVDLIVAGCWGRQRAILDLKTGRSAPHVWLQLGAYALALGEMGTPVDDLGVVKIYRGETGASDYELRPAAPIMAEIESQLERVTEVLEGERPAEARPGMHCPRCGVSDCLLRYHPRNGK